MTLTIDFWQLLAIAGGLVVAFATVVWKVSQITVRQYDRMLSDRFAVVSAQLEREAEGLRALERDFLLFKADLPLQYVRREDFVRNQTVIEAKLDGLALRIENIQLKGNQHAN